VIEEDDEEFCFDSELIDEDELSNLKDKNGYISIT